MEDEKPGEPQTGYVKTLLEQGKLFEIIVIDGNWRKKCVDEAIKCLKEGGMIVLADSDRMIEKNAVDYSESKGSFKWISADLVQLTVIAGQRQFL